VGFGIDTDRAQAEELLERHRPVLRFDPQYDYRLLAAESALDNPGNILRRLDGEVIAGVAGRPSLSTQSLVTYPEGLAARRDDCIAMAPDHAGDARRMEWSEAHRGRIYGRVARDQGRTWLQYWFWLYYNPKNLLGFGKHEGDWEMIQIGLGADGAPEVATYAQHDSGEARPWREGDVELAPGDPQRPVVYIAPLSHASYFQPNTHPYFLGIDHPFAGGPVAADLPVVPFGPWVEWRGRWGSSERKILGRIGGGPASPRWQNPKWEQPGVWHQRLRYRRPRAVLGKLMHAAGRLTYPSAPEITASEVAPGKLEVRWELQGRGNRRGRHIYVTAHDRHFVIASRVIEGAESVGSATLVVPGEHRPTAVMASTYNRLRQRSDIVEVRLGARGGEH
jgi:hypothetical protein